MSAPPDSLPLVVSSIGAPSVYADQMPKLREFAALPAEDRRRRVLREELVLAFMPVVEHLALLHLIRQRQIRGRGAHPGRHGRADHRDRPVGSGAGPRRVPRLPLPCVRGEMLRWFRDRTWSMRVPRRLKDLSGPRRAAEPLAQELGRAPRPSELAARLGVGVGESSKRSMRAAGAHAGSLDGVDPGSVCPWSSRSADRRRPREGRGPACLAAAAGRAARTGPHDPHPAVLR